MKAPHTHDLDFMDKRGMSASLKAVILRMFKDSEIDSVAELYRLEKQHVESDEDLTGAGARSVTAERFRSTRTNHIRLQSDISFAPRSKLLVYLADDANFRTPPPPPLPPVWFVEHPRPAQVVEQPRVQLELASPNGLPDPVRHRMFTNPHPPALFHPPSLSAESRPPMLPLPSIVDPRDVPAPISMVLQPEMRSRTLHPPPYCPRPRPVPSSVPADWSGSVGYGSRMDGSVEALAESANRPPWALSQTGPQPTSIQPRAIKQERGPAKLDSISMTEVCALMLQFRTQHAGFAGQNRSGERDGHRCHTE